MGRIAKYLCLLLTCCLAPATHAQDLLQGATPTYARVIRGEPPPTEFKPELKIPPHTQTIRARFAFDVADPAQAPAWVLAADPHIIDATLNGEPIELPLKGPRYAELYNIRAAQLKQGGNVLEVSWIDWVKPATTKDAKLTAQLRPQKLEDARLTGPIISHITETSAIISCRTSVPMAMTLDMEGRATMTSPTGYYHRFDVGGLSAGQNYTYSVAATLAEPAHKIPAGPYTFRTLPAAGPLTFAMFADTQGNLKVYSQVAAAMAKHQPSFVVHGGDFVDKGKFNNEWDTDGWAPAKELMATVPFYMVLGNHDDKSPILRKLFAVPEAMGNNWAQQFGPVLIIGADYNDRFSEGADAHEWLDRVLAESKAPYVFLMNHTPAFSSSKQGPSKVAAQFLYPMLKKHGATAMIAGHEHCYERIEPPDGPSHIITGGGGGGFTKQLNVDPNSKVYHLKNHYLIFTVDEKSCVMRAFDLEGNELDTRTWEPRPLSK